MIGYERGGIFGVIVLVGDGMKMPNAVTPLKEYAFTDGINFNTEF